MYEKKRKLLYLLYVLLYCGLLSVLLIIVEFIVLKSRFFVLVQNLLTMVNLENMLGLGIPLILKETLCLKMSFPE